ncbi:sugar transferase [Listeria sp. W9-0585]|uniref:Sugar transferase n=2 Tax=Listeria rustica TaxID=2713503 RepID=A0A7W1YFI2_9LIST|nr:sugar transferase [Listeria rustica]
MFVACVMLLILSVPMLLLLCITTWKFKEQPIFTQKRIGKDGRIFKIYKVKTMRTLVAANGQTLSDADRMTAFGHFLRQASLDELPQLVNVLLGDISFVGPRPLLPEYLEEYTDEQKRRHEVLPGITGWAQVNGRNNISWEDKFKLDVWYVDHKNVFLDMKIMILTVIKVVKREDISKAGFVTTEKFTKSEIIKE